MKIAASAFKAARRWAHGWSPVPGAYAHERGLPPPLSTVGSAAVGLVTFDG